MNLFRAELSRFLSRRFIRLMMLMLVAAFAVMVMSVLDSSRQASEEEWEDARATAASMQRQLQFEYSTCLTVREDKASCEAFNPDRVRVEDFLWGVFNFARESQGLTFFLIAFLTFFGVLVAASFIGAELTSGGMTNLLLWRPNRTVVLGTKLGVALCAVAAVSAVYSVLYLGGFYVLAVTQGWVGNTDRPGFWTDLIGVWARGMGFVLLTSAIAFAIAIIGRHTAAALGAFVGYALVWEVGARIIINVVHRQSDSSFQPWFLASYVGAWFEGPNREVVCFGCSRTGFTESAIVFAVLLVGSLVFAFATFRRRDLT